MKTILVTGCAGFIGSHLCEHLLQQQFSIIGVDNFDSFYSRSIKEKNIKNLLNAPKFTLINFDIADPSIINILPENVDAVIHLAAKVGVLPSINDPHGYTDTNIIGTKNILEYLRTKSINKFIFASSSSVYGNSNLIPFHETDKIDEPISPYAFSKKSCELMNYTYHYLYKIDVLNLRFFTVYGPRQRPDLAIHKFFKSFYNNKVLKIYGDGSSARDYTYISDLVDGIIGALNYILSNRGVFENVNLGSSKPIRIMDLIQNISEVLNKTPILEYEAFKLGDMELTYASIDKAKRLFSYSPKVPLKEGLNLFKIWYEQEY